MVDGYLKSGCRKGVEGSNPSLSFEYFVSQNGVGSRLSIHKLLINLKMVAVATRPCMIA